MEKRKLMILGGIALFAIALIIIGALTTKKDEGNSVPTNPGIARPDSEDNPLDGDGVGELPSRGIVTTDISEIYKIEKKEVEGKKQSVLEHETLTYEVTIPDKDLKKIVVEQTEKDGIYSTGFYYEGEEVTALVFTITNYPATLWEDLNGTTGDVPIGETPIRVLTYAMPSENPFDPESKESEEYLRLVAKVPSYLETFKMIEKKTE